MHTLYSHYTNEELARVAYDVCGTQLEIELLQRMEGLLSKVKDLEKQVQNARVEGAEDYDRRLHLSRNHDT
jgi:hypothetical protein